MAPPVRLFPPPPSISFVKDGKLDGGVTSAIATLTGSLNRSNTTRAASAQAAADAVAHAPPHSAARASAVAAEKIAKKAAAFNWKVPIPFSLVIIDLDDGGTNTLKWGGYKADELHYIASSPKMGCMYAAFALRDMVRRFWSMEKMAEGVNALTKKLGGKPMALPGSLVAGLHSQMDPEIETAAPKLLASVSKGERLPSYGQVFTTPGKGFGSNPSFNGHFESSMRAMIVPSDNGGAGRCIRGVGYGYLNGALAAAGLFGDKAKVWLAGDYVGQYHYVRINSANDGGVAQAGTALGMGQLLALIMNRGVVFDDAEAYVTMHRLLADAAKGVDQPFLSRDFKDDSVDASVRIPLNKITHAKLGQGPLKTGSDVRSEAFRLAGLAKPHKNYVVSFQNVNARETSLDHVGFVLRRAIELYES